MMTDINKFVEIMQDWGHDNGYIFLESEAHDLFHRLEVKPSPEPEMWINEYPNMPDSHMGKHPRNSNCKTLGCIPYVAEDKNNPEIVREVVKEKSYAERQAEWVKANGVKVGDRVKIITSNHHAPKHLNGIMGIIEHIDDERIDVKCRGEQYNYSYKYDELEIVPQIAPAPAAKLPEGFEYVKFDKLNKCFDMEGLAVTSRYPISKAVDFKNFAGFAYLEKSEYKVRVEPVLYRDVAGNLHRLYKDRMTVARPEFVVFEKAKGV